MKSRLPFLLVVLALVTSALGQQMVSTPAPISGSPTPSSEATPEAKPAPAAEERPAVKSASLPTTTVAPVATSSQKPAAKPVPKAEPDTTRPPSKRSLEATLKEMENRWESAIVAHDASVVDALVASDFSGVDSKGKFVNKSALIAAVKSDKDSYKSAKNEKLNVHIYGPTVAVVTGSARAKGITTAGYAFDRSYRYTDTWVERNGTWHCVASQNALAREK